MCEAEIGRLVGVVDELRAKNDVLHEHTDRLEVEVATLQEEKASTHLPSDTPI